MPCLRAREKGRRSTPAATLGLGAALACVACLDVGPPSPPPFRLIEKGPYQILYGANGRLDRVLHDADGDGRADAIVYYDAHGKPLRSEVDSDHDGAIDVWERILSDDIWVEERDTDGNGKADEFLLHESGGRVTPIGPTRP